MRKASMHRSGGGHFSKQNRTQRSPHAPHAPHNRHLQNSRIGLPLTLMLAACGWLSTPAQAQQAPNTLPTGGTVAAGAAAINQTGPAALRIDQTSQKAIINWTSFNIGQAASVHFAQPNAAAITLNRVGADGGRSLIDGQLTANGQVWLLNPGGVFFSPTARVDVGGLVASSLKLGNDDFLSGNYRFSKDGAGSIVNQGQLTAAEGGYLALLAPEVRNEGVISARLGAVALASGEELRLDFVGDRLIEITVDKAAVAGLVENRHLIEADGGWVLMSTDAASRLAEGAINNSGIIQAQTIAEHEGVIKLLGGTTQVGGTLDASAPNGGDGGFIETSGHIVNIDPTAHLTTLAASGKTGTWLIDPYDWWIESSPGHPNSISGSILSSNLNYGNVTILTNTGTGTDEEPGDIFVNDAVSWNPTSTSTTLTLQADRNITINSLIQGGVNSSTPSVRGAITLTAGQDVLVNNEVWSAGPMTVSGGRDVILTASSTASAGLFTLGAQSVTATGELKLTGAPVGAQKQAVIGSLGAQTISANKITLLGGGISASDADNRAAIEHGYKYVWMGTPYYGTGEQTINLTGTGAVLSLTGGDGSGTGLDSYGSSANRARVRNEVGSQTVNFATSGGSILIQGGSFGAGNSAEIDNHQFKSYDPSGVLVESGPLPGAQELTGNPNITLIGGASGGRAVYTSGAVHTIENDAGIWTEGASQSIDANHVTIKGNADGASSSTLGGAGIGGEPSSGSFTQTIDIAGNLIIIGGLSNGVAVSGAPTPTTVISGPSGIMNETAGGAATISSTLNVAGSLSMTGGASVYSPAVIGSGKGQASLNLNVTGTTLLDTGTNHSTVGIGSFGTLVGNDGAAFSAYANKVVFGKQVTGSTTVLQSSATGPAIIIKSPNGNLINEVGSAVLSVPATGYWDIYASTPSTYTSVENLGGLAYAFKQYNASYGTSLLGSGNGLLYSTEPWLSIHFNTGSTVSKVYDGSTSAPISSSNFSVSYAYPGDTVSVSGTYDTPDVGTGKLVTASGFSVRTTNPAGTSVPVYGYQFYHSPSMTYANIGTITARPVTNTATTNTETSVVADSTPVIAETTADAATQPEGGTGSGGATMVNFQGQRQSDEPSPPPKLIVDATKSVPKQAGVLTRTELQAINQQVHEARTQLFSDALAKLAKDPTAADIPDCGAGGGDVCIAAGKPLITTVEGISPIIKRKVALLIGNNSYRSPIPGLETAIGDVTAIGAELKDKLGYEVKIVQNASRKEIVAALNDLINNTERDESVLVMYAGHGYLDEKSGTGYWIPTDAAVTSPDNWISNATISKALANIPAKQVMLVSDSCYSGSLTKEGKVVETVGVDREKVLTTRSVLAMSSGGDEPVSDEGRDNHSIFAWNMIQSLKKMTGEISGSQLHTGIRAAVASAEFPQVPQYGTITSAGHREGGEYLLSPKN